jgi:hypothetical protein
LSLRLPRRKVSQFRIHDLLRHQLIDRRKPASNRGENERSLRGRSFSLCVRTRVFRQPPVSSVRARVLGGSLGGCVEVQVLGGSPRIYAGEATLRRCGKSCARIKRLQPRASSHDWTQREILLFESFDFNGRRPHHSLAASVIGRHARNARTLIAASPANSAPRPLCDTIPNQKVSSGAVNWLSIFPARI